MGPRVFTRGNDGSNEGLSGYVVASMGPRVFTRGNKIDDQVDDHRGMSASMGPRVFTRGNARLFGITGRSSSSFNGATRLHAWKPLVTEGFNDD